MVFNEIISIHENFKEKIRDVFSQINKEILENKTLLIKELDEFKKLEEDVFSHGRTLTLDEFSELMEKWWKDKVKDGWININEHQEAIDNILPPELNIIDQFIYDDIVEYYERRIKKIEVIEDYLHNLDYEELDYIALQNFVEAENQSIDFLIANSKGKKSPRALFEGGRNKLKGLEFLEKKIKEEILARKSRIELILKLKGLDFDSKKEILAHFHLLSNGESKKIWKKLTLLGWRHKNLSFRMKEESIPKIIESNLKDVKLTKPFIKKKKQDDNIQDDNIQDDNIVIKEDLFEFLKRCDYLKIKTQKNLSLAFAETLLAMEETKEKGNVDEPDDEKEQLKKQVKQVKTLNESQSKRANEAENKLKTEQEHHCITNRELNGLKDKLHQIFEVKGDEKLKDNWESDINSWKDTAEKYKVQFANQKPVAVRTEGLEKLLGDTTLQEVHSELIKIIKKTGLESYPPPKFEDKSIDWLLSDCLFKTETIAEDLGLYEKDIEKLMETDWRQEPGGDWKNQLIKKEFVVNNLGLKDNSELTEDNLKVRKNAYEIYEALGKNGGLKNIFNEDGSINRVELTRCEEKLIKITDDQPELEKKIADLTTERDDWKYRTSEVIKEAQDLQKDYEKKLTPKEMLTSDEKEFLDLIPWPLHLVENKKNNEKEEKNIAKDEDQIRLAAKNLWNLLYEKIDKKYSKEERTEKDVRAIHFPNLKAYNVSRILSLMNDILNLRGQVKQLAQENELLKSDNPAKLAETEGYLPLNEAERILNQRVQNGGGLLGGEIILIDEVKEFWEKNGNNAGVKEKYPNLFGYLYKIHCLQMNYEREWKDREKQESDLKIVGIKKDWQADNMFGKYETERKDKLQKLGQAKTTLLNELGIDIYDDKVNINTELQNWKKKEQIITDAENFLGLNAGKLATIKTDYTPTGGGIENWIAAYNNKNTDKDNLDNQLKEQKQKINNLLDRNPNTNLPTEWEDSLATMKEKARNYDMLINDNNDLVKDNKIAQSEIDKLKTAAANGAEGGVSENDYDNLQNQLQEIKTERADFNLHYNNIRSWLLNDKKNHSANYNLANPIQQKYLEIFVKALNQVNRFETELETLIENKFLAADTNEGNWFEKVMSVKLSSLVLNKQIKIVRKELNINPTITDNVNNQLQESDLTPFAEAHNKLKAMENKIKKVLFGNTATSLTETWENDLVKKSDLNAEQNEHKNTKSDLTAKNFEITRLNNEISKIETDNNLKTLIKTASGKKEVDNNELTRVGDIVKGSANNYSDLTNKLKQTEQERDSYKEQLSDKEKSWQAEKEQLLKEKEQEIVQKLNNELALKLTGEPTLKAVISKIKELLTDPSNLISIESLQNQLKQAQQTIVELQTQSEKIDHIKQISRQVIEKMVSQSAYQIFSQKIGSLTDYQAIKNLEQETLTQHFINKSDCQAKKEKLMSQQKTERIIFGSLLVASLLTISGLIYKMKTSKKIGKK